MTNVMPIHQKKYTAEAPPDEVLLRDIATGDMGAMAALYTRYQMDVFRFLARLSGTDNQELDDLVQSTFLQVMRSAKNFEYRSTVKSWMFGIGVNVARHHVRSAVRRKLAMNSLRHESTNAVHTVEIHQEAETRERMAALETAMGVLSYRLKTAFVLCDIEGLSGAEAAKSLGVNEGTVWRRLHVARKKLAVELERRSLR